MHVCDSVRVCDSVCVRVCDSACVTVRACVGGASAPPAVVGTVQQLLSRLHVFQEKLSAGLVVIDAASDRNLL